MDRGGPRRTSRRTRRRRRRARRRFIDRPTERKGKERKRECLVDLWEKIVPDPRVSKCVLARKLSNSKRISSSKVSHLEQKSKRKHHHDLSSHLVVLSHDQEDEDEDAALSLSSLRVVVVVVANFFALFFERDFIREREKESFKERETLAKRRRRPKTREDIFFNKCKTLN